MFRLAWGWRYAVRVLRDSHSREPNCGFFSADRPVCRPLVQPAHRTQHVSQRSLAQWHTAIARFKGQDLLLQIWCETHQIEDLGQPRPRHPESPRRLSLIPNLAPVDRMLNRVGEGERHRDPSRSAGAL